MSSQDTLRELKDKLAEEESLYADLLARLDSLAVMSAPYDQDPSIPSLVAELNKATGLDAETAASAAAQPAGPWARLLRRFVAAELDDTRRALEAQRSFNSTLVQFLNRFAETTNRAAAAQAEFASTLVGFAQRIDRLADAKDRLYASLGNDRCDLLLQRMDQRLETVRLGIDRLGRQVEGMDSSIAIARAEIRGLARLDEASDASASSAARFEPEHYVAFEQRFRGSSEELRERLEDYAVHFESLEPVIDLGCGRGEFLEVLRSASIAAKGVDDNREMVQACRDKGLDADLGDVIGYLAGGERSSAGGVFAAQLVEHLPPSALQQFLGDCHRVVRDGGRVVLETVNPRSVTAFLGFYRDLTHQKPLHPETLDFMLRAAGFRDVVTVYRSPVSERARLLHLTEGEERETLNENFEKLNALLFGEQDYAAIATK